MTRSIAFNQPLDWDTRVEHGINSPGLQSAARLGHERGDDDGDTFNNAEAFNQMLAWDTSSVTTIKSTFRNAKAFNSQLDWDTSSVTTMDSTFNTASAFNQPLAWDTSSVTTMQCTFFNAQPSTRSSPGIRAR